MKNGELEICRKLNFNTYLNNEERTIKFEKLLIKYRNVLNIINFQKLVKEYNSYHNGFCLIDKFINLNIEYIEENIKKTKTTGIKEVSNVYYKTFVQNKEKLEQIKFLMEKFKDNEKVIKFNNLIKEYNNLNKYSCLVCGEKNSKLYFEKEICYKCFEKSGKNEYYKVKCSKCNDLKPIKDYPKEINNIKWGAKLLMCKSCDNKHYLEIRRDNSYKYSLTKKGKENLKKNLKILEERSLCSSINLNNYLKSTIKIRDFKVLNLMNIINKNERFRKYFNENMTLEEFFITKKDLNLEFDHIIPKSYPNKIYNEFHMFKELINLKGKKELKNRISKIMNNEINIQLLKEEENNAKNNSIDEKYYWLKDDLRLKIQEVIVELYLKLKKEEEN